MTQYWITLKNVGNDGKIVVEFNENEVISEYFVAGETEMHHSVNITNEIEAIKSSVAPKYTREELVEILEGISLKSWIDPITSLPMVQMLTGFGAICVIDALEQAGALQVKQTELHNDSDLQGKI